MPVGSIHVHIRILYHMYDIVFKKLLLHTELEWDYNGNMEHATLTPSFVKKSTRKCVMYLVKSKLSIQLHVVVSPCKPRLRAHHVTKKC